MTKIADRISVVKGDITMQQVDAIVNAANATLLGGGGVDGAIHRAAGPSLLEECRALGGCPTGEARITGAYALACSFVIHTVGPVWQGGDAEEDLMLEACYRNSLKLARDHGIRTIAFPAISCGVYRFPVDRAARIAIGTTVDFLAKDISYRHVLFVCFEDRALRAFRDAKHALIAS